MTIRKSSVIGWISLLCCLAANLIFCGFVANQQGLLIDPICTSLDLPRSLYSSLQSVSPIANAVASMFFVKLLEKVGLKKMAILGGVCAVLYCVCYYLSALAGSASVVLMVAAQVFLGVNMSWATAMTASIVITNWFAKNTSLLISVYAAFSAVGGMIAAPIVSKVIAASGWQTTMILYGVGCVVVLVLFIVIFKPQPSEKEAMVWEGEAAGDDGAVVTVGLTYDQARKTKNYMMCVVFCFSIGLCLYSPFMCLAAFCADSGLGDIIGTAMSVVFGAQIVFSLVMGPFIEKFGVRKVIAPLFVIFMLTMLAFAVAPSKAIVLVGACVLGAGMACCNALTPLMAGNVFGSRDFASIQSKFYTPMIVGMVVGPPIFNAAYDLAGSYKVIFLINIALLAIAIFALVSATKKIDFEAYN